MFGNKELSLIVSAKSIGVSRCSAFLNKPSAEPPSRSMVPKEWPASRNL